MLPQKGDRELFSACAIGGGSIRNTRLGSVRRFRSLNRFAQPALDLRNTGGPMHPSRPPRTDVSAAGHGRQVVYLRQQPEVGKGLNDPEIESGAAYAAAGERQAAELAFRRALAIGIVAEADRRVLLARALPVCSRLRSDRQR